MLNDSGSVGMTAAQRGRMGRRRDTMSKRTALLAILLAMLFFGHDIIMAADASSPLPAGVAGPGRGAGHVSAPVPAPHDRDGAGSNHPEECGVGQAGAHRRVDGGDPPERATTDLAWPDSVGGDRRAGVAPARWTEPHWPARTRRALWQVYRI
jgi:hypothetical protein